MAEITDKCRANLLDILPERRDILPIPLMDLVDTALLVDFPRNPFTILPIMEEAMNRATMVASRHLLLILLNPRIPEVHLPHLHRDRLA